MKRKQMAKAWATLNFWLIMTFLATAQANAAEVQTNTEQAFVLSIDGGGVNGLLPALALEHLGECLKARGVTDQLAHHFYVVAGTSTGSIIVAALVTPREPGIQEATNPSELVELHRKHAQTIFPNVARLKGENPWHVFDKIMPASIASEARLLARAMNTPVFSSVGLRNVLGQHLGRHTNRDAITRYLITGYDVYFGPVAFVTEGLLRDGPTGQKSSVPLPATMPMIDQVLASTAAPTFLPPHRVPVQFEAGRIQGGANIAHV